MAATVVKLLLLLTCLHQNHAITPGRAADNAVGYSRIVVATPGMRRYTYDIAHDPEGRDFSIDFSPIDRDLDLNNFLPEPEGRFLPQYDVIPVTDNEEIQLHVKHPTHEEMEKSSRAIQNVHAAYSKKPPQPQKAMLEDFDLGIMGYGDFMDPQDEHRVNNPAYVSHSPVKQFQHLGLRPNMRYKQYLTQPKAPYLPKKLYPKAVPQKAYVEKVETPQIMYEAPIKLQKPLFVPAFDEGRLNGLADKAYSKVFMAHGFSKPVPRFYPKQGLEGEGIDMAKTLFVPVVLVPGSQQKNKESIDRTSLAAFEPRRIVKKQVQYQ
ncbi:uncharacterized protein LOC128987344 [Macrosteles quadrilineatus]|uniref:uncharacterized protein LOC128987344 n=1 Tax=Macrosteles quadrilineatus TaxID=74068 RepID=UPI0023E24864|nr:uncharacterized protein LOC128987344 [Macrosteles quadrilineatus]